MRPSEKQQEHIDRIVGEPSQAALVNLATGAGKTLVAMSVSKALAPDQVLIIAPLNTRGGWKVHAERVWPERPFLSIESRNSNFEKLALGHSGIYFVTKDYFALSGSSAQPREKEDGTLTRGRAKKHNWRRTLPLVVLDESHRANNRDATVYKVLRQLSADWKIALSATPAGNKFHRLWETTRWLWPDVVDRSKQRWAAMYCRTEYNPFNYSHTEIVGEKEPGAFVATLPCYITDNEEFKVPTKTINVLTPMTAKQRAQYQHMLNDSLVWIGGNPLVAELPLVQKIRLRQIALGEVTFDDDLNVSFAADCESSKINACHAIVLRHPGAQILFYTDSKKFAHVLAKRLGSEARAWTGDLSGPARDRLKADFINGGVRFIVAVISAFGTGTDGLHLASNVEVWCNRGFNDVENVQCEGRLNRRGQDADHIVRYTLTAPDSGDTLDFERLMKNRAELQKSL